MSVPDSILGQTITHYRILKKLGAGGMGVVYEAEDVRLNRHVALKFLPAQTRHDSVALARFLREARSVSALNHPNVCTLYDVGQYNESPFLNRALDRKRRVCSKPGCSGQPIGRSSRPHCQEGVSGQNKYISTMANDGFRHRTEVSIQQVRQPLCAARSGSCEFLRQLGESSYVQKQYRSRKLQS